MIRRNRTYGRRMNERNYGSEEIISKAQERTKILVDKIEYLKERLSNCEDILKLTLEDLDILSNKDEISYISNVIEDSYFVLETAKGGVDRLCKEINRLQ